MSRLDRVSALILKEVGNIIQTKVSDPRIGFASLTGVEISPDLKYAKIFVSVLGTKNEKIKSLKGLKSAAGFIQSLLNHRLQMRYVPEIRFFLDPSLERGDRILNILNQMQSKKDVPANKKRTKKSA